MATREEQLRKARSRPVVGLAIVLWLFGIISGFFPAVTAGILGVAVLPDLPGALNPFGDGSIQLGWIVGFFGTAALAIFGYPLAMLFADRLGPWMVRAKLPDPTNPDHRAMVESVQLVSLAAGVDPILYIAPGTWVNAAPLGKRGRRPVLIVSAGVTAASREGREFVAASVLAESMGGRGAGRVWLATRAPALFPLAVARFLLLRPKAVMAAVVAWVAMVTTVSGAPPVGVLIMAAVCLTPAGLIYGFWLLMLSAGSRVLAAVSHSNADLGAIALLRHPENWAYGMIAVAAHRRSRPDPLAYASMEWVLPVSERAAEKRVRSLKWKVPAVAHSLAAQDTTLRQQAA